MKLLRWQIEAPSEYIKERKYFYGVYKKETDLWV